MEHFSPEKKNELESKENTMPLKCPNELDKNFIIKENAKRALKKFIPITSWIHKYNLKWFFRDLLSGITVGCLVIPQALAYSKLVGVPLQYGLYTAFVGLFIYPIFATSKDVTIGPTAIMSQLLGQIVATHGAGEDPILFVAGVSLFAGLIQLLIGFCQFGILVNLIGFPVIVGFTSGAAIQIIIGQLSSIFGIKGVDTTQAPYLVITNTITKFRLANDAYFGVGAIIFLIMFRLLSGIAVKRGLASFSWIRHTANIAVLVFFSLIAFLVWGRDVSKVSIRLVSTIPQGLQAPKLASLDNALSIISPTISVVLVGIIEHIAMVKAFGRINGYQADPNQEIAALGIINVIASFLGAFPSTGSLSRSSINSRSGVKSPFSGFFAGFIVLGGIYFLTPLFYFIPYSVLGAVITVSISDIIASPSVLHKLWLQKTEFLTFLIALVVTLFVTIEDAIFAAVGFSVGCLLYRIARPHIELEVYQNGVVVVRVDEALTFPNAAHVTQRAKQWIGANIRYSGTRDQSQIPWSDDPCGALNRKSESLKTLFTRTGAVFDGRLDSLIFDLSRTNHIDTTGLQALVDIRREAEAQVGASVRVFFVGLRPALQPLVSGTSSATVSDCDDVPVKVAIEDEEAALGVTVVEETCCFNTVNDVIQAISAVAPGTGAISITTLANP